jgi:FkbM family methyltransferase
MKIIYDVGANIGEDIDYYLMKADKVVAIDANPYAIDSLKKNFRQQLASGRLTLVHCAIDARPGELIFQVNHKQSALSRKHVIVSEVAQFGDLTSADAWEQVTVPSTRLSDIVRDHGEPHYIKIDIEGSEEIAMHDLYSSRIRPPYISNELGYTFHACQCYMYLMGYRNFQIVNMNTLHNQFAQHPITLLNGEQVRHDFARGTSGPFGEDLPNWWVDFERLGFFVASRNLIFGNDPWNWYDVHARSSS